jgi:ribosomal protein S12 methylthiotransferase accessory factor
MISQLKSSSWFKKTPLKVTASLVLLIFIFNTVAVDSCLAEVLSSRQQNLSVLPFTERITFSHALAQVYIKSRLVWVAHSKFYKDLLERYDARALLLPSGRYLMDEDTRNNPIKFMRAVTHEDFEILWQLEERNKESHNRYSTLRDEILKRDDILALYSKLPDKSKALRTAARPIDDQLRVIIERHKLKNKRKGPIKLEQARNILFNDIMSSAFELHFLIEENVLRRNELTQEERDFLDLIRPGQYTNLSPLFFNKKDRTDSILRLQKQKGKAKDEKFVRVANEENDAKEPSEPIEKAPPDAFMDASPIPQGREYQPYNPGDYVYEHPYRWFFISMSGAAANLAVSLASAALLIVLCNYPGMNVFATIIIVPVSFYICLSNFNAFIKIFSRPLNLPITKGTGPIDIPHELAHWVVFKCFGVRTRLYWDDIEFAGIKWFSKDDRANLRWPIRIINERGLFPFNGFLKLLHGNKEGAFLPGRFIELALRAYRYLWHRILDLGIFKHSPAQTHEVAPVVLSGPVAPGDELSQPEFAPVAQVLAGWRLAPEATDQEVDDVLLKVVNGSNRRLKNILGFNAKQREIMEGRHSKTIDDLVAMGCINELSKKITRGSIRLAGKCRIKYGQAFLEFIRLALSIRAEDTLETVKEKTDAIFSAHKHLLDDKDFLASFTKYFRGDYDIMLFLTYVLWLRIRTGPEEGVRPAVETLMTLINVKGNLAEYVPPYRIKAIERIGSLGDLLQRLHYKNKVIWGIVTPLARRLQELKDTPGENEYYRSCVKALINLSATGHLTAFYELLKQDSDPGLAKFIAEILIQGRPAKYGSYDYLERALRHPDRSVKMHAYHLKKIRKILVGLNSLANKACIRRSDRRSRYSGEASRIQLIPVSIIHNGAYAVPDEEKVKDIVDMFKVDKLRMFTPITIKVNRNATMDIDGISQLEALRRLGVDYVAAHVIYYDPSLVGKFPFIDIEPALPAEIVSPAPDTRTDPTYTVSGEELGGIRLVILKCVMWSLHPLFKCFPQVWDAQAVVKGIKIMFDGMKEHFHPELMKHFNKYIASSGFIRAAPRCLNIVFSLFGIYAFNFRGWIILRPDLIFLGKDAGLKELRKKIIAHEIGATFGLSHDTNKILERVVAGDVSEIDKVMANASAVVREDRIGKSVDFADQSEPALPPNENESDVAVEFAPIDIRIASHEQIERALRRIELSPKIAKRIPALVHLIYSRVRRGTDMSPTFKDEDDFIDFAKRQVTGGDESKALKLTAQFIFPFAYGGKVFTDNPEVQAPAPATTEYRHKISQFLEALPQTAVPEDEWFGLAVKLSRLILRDDSVRRTGEPERHACQTQSGCLALILNRMGVASNIVGLEFKDLPIGVYNGAQFCIKTTSGIYIDPYPEGMSVAGDAIRSEEGVVIHPGDKEYYRYSEAERRAKASSLYSGIAFEKLLDNDYYKGLLIEIAAPHENAISTIADRYAATTTGPQPEATLHKDEDYQEPALSNYDIEAVYDISYAIREIDSKGYADKATIEKIVSDRNISQVCLGLSSAEVASGIDPEEFERLKNALFILNAMTGRSLDILLVKDGQAVIFERERLRLAAIRAGILAYPFYYGKHGAGIVELDSGLTYFIISDFAKRKGFFFDFANLKKNVAAKYEEAQSISSKILKSEGEAKRPLTNPITDLAFPSVRDAATLEKCVRTHLAAIRLFGHEYPAIWVMDDATDDMAAEKQVMLQRLAAEFGVKINYVGEKEKNAFLDTLSQDPAIKERGLSRDDLVRIYFQPGKFGSNRNFIQCYLSGRIYATVDDDSESNATIERNFAGSRTCYAAQRAFIAIFVPLVRMLSNSRFDKASLAEIKSIAEDMVSDVKDGSRFSLAANHLYRMLELAYRQDKTKVAVVNALLSKCLEELPLESGEFQKGAALTIGIKDILRGARVLDIDDEAPYITVPVNAYGVHARYIARDVDDLEAMRLRKIEGDRLYVGDGLPSPGKIAFVASHTNLFGAGSSGNYIGIFCETGNVDALVGLRERSRLLPIRSYVADSYKVSTATMLTVDNRLSRGLVVPGMIDSHPLGMAIQRGDSGLKLIETMTVLDHNRIQSDIRTPEDDEKTDIPVRAAKNEIDEIGLMTALRIHFGDMGREEAITYLLTEELATVESIKQLIREKRDGLAGSSNKEEDQRAIDAASAIIETIRRALGGIEMPTTTEVIERKAKAARKRKSVFPVKVMVTSFTVAREMLADLSVREAVAGLIKEYEEKVEEVERYSDAVHSIAKDMHKKGELPFTIISSFFDVGRESAADSVVPDADTGTVKVVSAPSHDGMPRGGGGERTSFERFDLDDPLGMQRRRGLHPGETDDPISKINRMIGGASSNSLNEGPTDSGGGVNSHAYPVNNPVTFEICNGGGFSNDKNFKAARILIIPIFDAKFFEALAAVYKITGGIRLLVVPVNGKMCLKQDVGTPNNFALHIPQEKLSPRWLVDIKVIRDDIIAVYDRKIRDTAATPGTDAGPAAEAPGAEKTPEEPSLVSEFSDLLNPEQVRRLYSYVYRSRRLSGDIGKLLAHVRRGGILADKISTSLGISKTEKNTVLRAFAAHDLGKMQNRHLWEIINSARVIPRKDPHNPERARINKHADFSGGIIRELGIPVDDEVVLLVRNHHTPKELRLGKLRLFAEIIYWADVVDALMAKRSYKINLGNSYDWVIESMEDLRETLAKLHDNNFKSGRCVHQEAYDAMRNFVETKEFASLYPETSLFKKTELLQWPPAPAAGKLLSLLDLSDPKKIPGAEIVSEETRCGGKVRRIIISRSSDAGAIPQRGVALLKSALCSPILYDVTTIELLYNDCGQLIAAFPIPPEKNDEKKLFAAGARYIDFSYYYFDVPEIGDPAAREKWKTFFGKLKDDRKIIDAYRSASRCPLRLITGSNSPWSPYVLVEIDNNGRWQTKCIMDVSDCRLGLLLSQIPASRDSNKSQLIIPVLPTVYLPETSVDRGYFKTVYERVDKNSEVLVIGPGAGPDSWVASLKTNKKICAVGINPFEIANLELTASMAGFEVETVTGDNIIREDGTPRFNGRRFDRILWNMPRYVEGESGEDAGRISHRLLESRWDGDRGGTVLKKFVRGLPSALSPGGLAILWNGVCRDRGPAGEVFDVVGSILKEAGDVTIAEEETNHAVYLVTPAPPAMHAQNIDMPQDVSRPPFPRESPARRNMSGMVFASAEPNAPDGIKKGDQSPMLISSVAGANKDSKQFRLPPRKILPGGRETVTENISVALGDRINLGNSSIRMVSFKKDVLRITGKACYRCDFVVRAPPGVHIVRAEIDDGRAGNLARKAHIKISRFSDSGKQSEFRIGDVRIKLLSDVKEGKISLKITRPPGTLISVEPAREPPGSAAPDSIAMTDKQLAGEPPTAEDVLKPSNKRFRCTISRYCVERLFSAFLVNDIGVLDDACRTLAEQGSYAEMLANSLRNIYSRGTPQQKAFIANILKGFLAQKSALGINFIVAKKGVLKGAHSLYCYSDLGFPVIAMDEDFLKGLKRVLNLAKKASSAGFTKQDLEDIASHLFLERFLIHEMSHCQPFKTIRAEEKKVMRIEQGFLRLSQDIHETIHEFFGYLKVHHPKLKERITAGVRYDALASPEEGALSTFLDEHKATYPDKSPTDVILMSQAQPAQDSGNRAYSLKGAIAFVICRGGGFSKDSLFNSAKSSIMPILDAEFFEALAAVYGMTGKITLIIEPTMGKMALKKDTSTRNVFNLHIPQEKLNPGWLEDIKLMKKDIIVRYEKIRNAAGPAQFVREAAKTFAAGIEPFLAEAGQIVSNISSEKPVPGEIRFKLLNRMEEIANLLRLEKAWLNRIYIEGENINRRLLAGALAETFSHGIGGNLEGVAWSISEGASLTAEDLAKRERILASIREFFGLITSITEVRLRSNDTIRGRDGYIYAPGPSWANQNINNYPYVMDSFDSVIRFAPPPATEAPATAKLGFLSNAGWNMNMGLGSSVGSGIKTGLLSSPVPQSPLSAAGDGEKNEPRGSLSRAIVTINHKWRGKPSAAFTKKEFQEARKAAKDPRSDTTVYSELNGLIKLGILEIVDNARPYRYRLTAKYARAPPQVKRKITAYLKKNLSARPEYTDERFKKAKRRIEELIMSATTAVAAPPMEYVFTKGKYGVAAFADPSSIDYVEPRTKMTFDEIVDYLVLHPGDHFMAGYFMVNCIKNITDEQVGRIIMEFEKNPITLWASTLFIASRWDNKRSIQYMRSYLKRKDRRLLSDERCNPQLRYFTEPHFSELREVDKIFTSNQVDHIMPTESDGKVVEQYARSVGIEAETRESVHISRINPRVVKNERSVDMGMGLRELTFEEAIRRINAIPEKAIDFRKVRRIGSHKGPPYNYHVKWYLNLTSSAGGNHYKAEGAQACFGKGMTEHSAVLSAIYEMFERASAMMGCGKNWPACYKNDIGLRKARYSELKNRKGLLVLDPNELNLPEKYSNEEIYWIRAKIRTRRGVRRVYVPAQFVFTMYNFDEASITGVMGYNTTGLSSGNTMDEAKRQGLLEVIERDGHIHTMFYSPERCFTIQAGDTDIIKMLEPFKKRGINIQFLDLTTEFGVPIYKAFVKVGEHLIIGCGADLDGRIAIRRALGELIPNIKAYEQKIRVMNASILDEPSKVVKVFEDIPNYSSGNVTSDVDMLERLLIANGYNPIYADLTRKDLDIPVVRVIVPGLYDSQTFDARQYKNFKNICKNASMPESPAAGGVSQSDTSPQLSSDSPDPDGGRDGGGRERDRVSPDSMAPKPETGAILQLEREVTLIGRMHARPAIHIHSIATIAKNSLGVDIIIQRMATGESAAGDSQFNLMRLSIDTENERVKIIVKGKDVRALNGVLDIVEKLLGDKYELHGIGTAKYEGEIAKLNNTLSRRSKRSNPRSARAPVASMPAGTEVSAIGKLANQQTDVANPAGEEVRTKFEELDAMVSGANVYNRSLSACGNRLNFDKVKSELRPEKLRLAIPIEVLKNSVDITLLLKKKFGAYLNIPFRLEVTGVKPEDEVVVSNLKNLLVLHDNIEVVSITEAAIIEKIGGNFSRLRELRQELKIDAIKRLSLEGAELLKNEYMLIVTDPVTPEEATEKWQSLKDHLSPGVSIRIMTSEDPKNSLFMLSRIINSWLHSIESDKGSSILRLPALVRPEEMMRELGEAVRTAWVALVAA